MPFRRFICVITMVTAASMMCGCRPTPQVADSGRIKVVTTTGILADLVKNVGEDHVDVTSIVPEGGDPHSYEPSLRDVREIVYADMAFTNYLMLEERRIVAAIDTNLPADAPNIALAEEAVKYAAEIIPLVENASLDTIWLGFRSENALEAGYKRSAEVEISATHLEGPGNLYAYLTGSFGDIEQYFNSSDGVVGDSEDTVTLPPDAHTHLSWAFSEPGVYTLSLRAGIRPEPTAQTTTLAEGSVTFAVGVDPYSVPGHQGATVLDSGHADISVDAANGGFRILHDSDPSHSQQNGSRTYYDLDDVVVSVPNVALHEVPSGPTYRFLGGTGDQIYQLPQAVLGKHVHGEIDPHLWHNVRNAQAYVQIIRDTLIESDPRNAADYTRNASDYMAQLDQLDTYVADTIAQIPESNRTLITTHDSFAYLAQRYGLRIAGFLTPNPSIEPSLAERKKLVETIRNLQVPAVFLEPNLVQRSSALTEIANEEGIKLCTILGDSFTREVNTYIDFMKYNANSLRECLTPSS